MKVISDIIKAYLNQESLEKYKNQWIYKTVGRGELQGENAFIMPPMEESFRSTVKIISDLMDYAVRDFIPVNKVIWDELFPGWKEILAKTEVHFIIGLPEPYDATVLISEDGIVNVILDIGCWVKYYGKCKLEEVVHNILTHELCHVCIHSIYQSIEADGEGEDYLTCLDANTFNEGFAHLLSYNDKNMDETDWKSDKLSGVFKNSKQQLKYAIMENDRSRQEKYLYDAIFGDYYNKYACMAGMLYLADCWMKNGTEALIKEFQRGYAGFASKVAHYEL